MHMRRATVLAAVLLLAAGGCAPMVPYHPPPHTGHPPMTNRGDGHGSTMPSAELTRAGGMYPGQGGEGLGRPPFGPYPEGQYGGGGYGTGTYGPIR